MSAFVLRVHARTARVPVALALGLLLPILGCAGAARYDAALHRFQQQAPPAPAPAPLPAAASLSRSELVAEVLRRNPTIAAARHAWRAALARYPQETALPDPMAAYSIGPRTIGSDAVPQEAHRFDVSQAFPFPGKLALRGAVALAEAEAAAGDHEAVRLRLAAMASMLYDEYWLLGRAEAINREHLELVRELRAIATARYESGAAEQQDPLRAEVAEAELLHRGAELAAAREVAARQLALLLHRSGAPALPPAPAALDPVAAPTDADVAEALDARPELRAAAARIAAREAAHALARRAFLPDFRLMGSYDRGWNETDMRPMVGLEINVPLRLGARRGAVEEAEAELARARSERERAADEVVAEVESARARWQAAHHGLEIARDRLLPAARDQREAARAAFEAGRTDFRDWIDAERALRDAELAVAEARAEASRRAAAWRAAVGRLPVDGPALATAAARAPAAGSSAPAPPAPTPAHEPLAARAGDSR